MAARRALLVLAASALFAGCQSASNTDAPVLVPRERYFGARDKSAVQLSPDGDRIAWIDIAAGRALIVHDPDSRASSAVAGSVVSYQWTFRPRELLIVRASSGRQQLVIQPVGSDARPLLDAAGVTIAALGIDRPDEAVINVRGGGQTPDGFARIDLNTGAMTALPELAGYTAAFFDGQLRLAAAQRPTPTAFSIDCRTEAGTWEPFQIVNVVDGISAGIVAVARDGSRIAFTTNEHSDTTRLELYDVRSGAREVLVHDAEADLLRIGATINPLSGAVQAIVSYRVRMIRHLLDPALATHYEYLARNGQGEVSMAGQSVDNDTWLVRFLDGGPARFALYELRQKKLTPLFSEIPSMDGVTLAARTPLEVVVRDGRKVRANVYLPADADADGNGIPDRPLPTLVFVHGGPWVGFDWNMWEMNRHFQLLTNRGYAVIRTSFRGEPGHGKSFVDAGDRAWGGAMIDDIIDVTRHAEKIGIAAPQRTGIFGWSFGGFATASALLRAPGQFRCGIALYGVFDIPAMMKTPMTQNDFWRQRVGDINDAKELARLRDESPLTHAAKMSRPIIVTHGGADSRVPAAQSEQFASALARHGKSVAYILFPDEEHDYAAKETWETFWAIGERFLAEHLGGGYQPVTGELGAAKMSIPIGAEDLRALSGRSAPSAQGR